jgi:DUF438 domain-containing protein
MAQLSDSRKAQALSRFFKRINQGEDPKLLRREVHRLLPSVEPNDIAAAEQNLIDEGYPVQVVQLLSATFMLMAIPERRSSSPKTWLAPNHILSMVIVEHDLMRCFIADLSDVVEDIGSLSDLTDVSSEFRRLVHLVEHLTAMKIHFEREDDVIFPYLKKYGKISFCALMQGDHVNIRTEIDNLASLITSFEDVTLEQFQVAVGAITRHLAMTMQEHLSQEDMILYPVALGMVRDARVWEKMKAFCDEIGYCGVGMRTEPGHW